MAFAALLMWVMVAATALTVTLPVVASFIIDDFGITRSQFGAVGAVGGLLAAVSSPYAGVATDRIGGRRAAQVVLGGSAAAAVVTAAAPSFIALFAGAAVGAVAGAAGNPSTNKLIASSLDFGDRGVVTGIKQTGPQVGSLLAGLLAPLGATTIGWRPTLVIMAIVLVLPAPALSKFVPDAPATGDRAPGVRGAQPPGIRWVAVYGFLLGLGGSATFLLPLFVEEELGQSALVAGWAAALLGGAAAVGRLQWARVAERRGQAAPVLVVLAIAAVGSMALMLVSIEYGTLWMWLATVVLAFSASSWTAVGAIAVITIAGPGGAGRASGIVWFGFLAGLGIGPPIYGYTVDGTGSYALMWSMALAVFAAAAAVSVAWMRRDR